MVKENTTTDQSTTEPPVLPPSPFHIGQRMFTVYGISMGVVQLVEFDKTNKEYKGIVTDRRYLTEREMANGSGGQVGKRKNIKPFDTDYGYGHWGT